MQWNTLYGLLSSIIDCFDFRDALGIKYFGMLELQLAHLFLENNLKKLFVP